MSLFSRFEEGFAYRARAGNDIDRETPSAGTVYPLEGNKLKSLTPEPEGHSAPYPGSDSEEASGEGFLIRIQVLRGRGDDDFVEILSGKGAAARPAHRHLDLSDD